MSALSRFEAFMENIVEGSVARLFRSPVQPAEIAKRLERAMESNQTVSVRRILVPNYYRAFLNPQDFETFKPIRAEVEREMATYLAELAQERGFSMVEHPRVELVADSGVPRRTIQVVAETQAAPAVSQSSDTQVIPAQPAAAPAARARLLLMTSSGTHVIPLDSTLMTIGRGLNNDIILEDARVSRNHAQLRYRSRRFWLTDLGSTNGTFVNGEPVTERALRDGDVVSLGGLELTFRQTDR
ncbi:MAG: FHA domain-containing protein [Roseiflexus sp.]|jgi:hypothetical protein|nr:FHA domain-containing protein [Roseiflexus sp.]MBO9335273.1 FHA domain-containing protein [Roseiflexus sp.]MBO9365013.1 FHA domain-containing protein [Roseiflexus sp.]MBO9381188.1 FHA domain-containing protein [Roseiflexus sp.]MBO9388142.1 FHA domain-containing protein [Roseiflexus sp.]